MSTQNYHNTIKSQMDLFKNAQSQLIIDICMELGCPEKTEQLTEKYIDKKIKLKKYKDKNAPKSASTAYQFFCNEQRPIIKTKNPDIEFKDIMKELSKGWKSVIDNGNIEKYQKLSDLDKERYSQEFETYKSELFSSTLSNT